MKLVFFRRPKPKQFDYKPLFWDEEKEELKKRKKQLERVGKSKTSDEVKEDIKYQIDNQWRMQREAARQKSISTRFIIYLAFIFVFVYLIFFTNFIDNFLSVFVR